jgi:UDP-N-acetylmuramoylalanine--D-glutamate ligase
MAAIRAFDEPLVLLAGGRDKDLPWTDFADLVRRRVDHLVLFGEAAEVIFRAVASENKASLTITRCPTLKDAVAAAAEIIQPGDVVLFSPGGTSYDEFNDFEERGECFEQWVNELT